jgi:hypothetical protein
MKKKWIEEDSTYGCYLSIPRAVEKARMRMRERKREWGKSSAVEEEGLGWRLIVIMSDCKRRC